VRVGNEGTDRAVVDQIDVAPGGVVVVAGVRVLVSPTHEERVALRTIHGQGQGLEGRVFLEDQSARGTAGIAFFVIEPDDHAEFLAGTDPGYEGLPVLLGSHVIVEGHVADDAAEASRLVKLHPEAGDLAWFGAVEYLLDAVGRVPARINRVNNLERPVGRGWVIPCDKPRWRDSGCGGRPWRCIPCRGRKNRDEKYGEDPNRGLSHSGCPFRRSFPAPRSITFALVVSSLPSLPGSFMANSVPMDRVGSSLV